MVSDRYSPIATLLVYIGYCLRTWGDGSLLMDAAPSVFVYKVHCFCFVFFARMRGIVPHVPYGVALNTGSSGHGCMYACRET